MQGSGPRLQAAIRLLWYWVMIAVKIALLPRPGAKSRPGGKGAQHEHKRGHCAPCPGARARLAPLVTRVRRVGVPDSAQFGPASMSQAGLIPPRWVGQGAGGAGGAGRRKVAHRAGARGAAKRSGAHITTEFNI